MISYIEDKRLSFDAIGVLAFLLHRGDPVTVKTVRARGRVGKDKAQKIFRSLVSLGYIMPSDIREEKSKRFKRIDYSAFDTPQREVRKLNHRRTELRRLGSMISMLEQKATSHARHDRT